MADLKVEIVSIEGTVFNGTCHLIVVPSASGEIGVMYGHEAIISNLNNGDIKIFDSSNNIIKQIPIDKGFAEMQNQDKLLILINQ